MVLKSAKHGVNSGNTLRASSSVHNIRDARDQLLVLHEVESYSCSLREKAQKSFKSGLEKNVYYSLNRKGRWDWPDELKESLVDGDHSNDCFKVSVLQKHRLNRRNNGVSYHATTFHGIKEAKSVDRKSSIYFNPASVIYEYRGARKWKQFYRRGNYNATPPEELTSFSEEDQPTEFRYEISLPAPRTSSISHNPKYIKYRDPRMGSPWYWYYCEDTDDENNKQKKKKQKTSSKFTYLRKPSKLYEEIAQDAEENDLPEDTTEAANLRELTLNDFIEQALTTVKMNLSNKTRRRCQKGHEKSQRKVQKCCRKDETLHVRYLTEETISNKVNKKESSDLNNNIVSTTNNSQREHKLLMYPVRVAVPTDEVTPSALSKTVGSMYLEGQSSPRRFIVDINENFQEMLRTLKCFNQEKWKFGHPIPTLVFVYEGPGDSGSEIYRVSLNISAKLNCICIETLCELALYKISDIIIRACQYMSMLPPDCFENKDLSSLKPRNSVVTSRLESLTSLKHWPRASYYTSEDNSGIFRQLVEKEKLQAFEREVHGLNGVPLCNICYSVIDQSSATCHPATALTSCGHWFCDLCWREHLTSRIEQGFLKLTCPEYKCNASIDLATLTSLLVMPEIVKHLKMVHNAEVTASPVKKWCPNPYCNNVIEANVASATAPLILSCLCGKVFCFHCQREPHWPVSCDGANKYHFKLKKNGDDISAAVDWNAGRRLRAKMCPKCGNVIEKNGGCPSMVCRCGFGFCWTCLKDSTDHMFTDECYDAADLDGTQTLEDLYVESLSKSKKNRSKLYSLACKHRILRHPTRMTTLREMIKPAHVKLQKEIIKSTKRRKEGVGEIKEGTYKPKEGSLTEALLSLVWELHQVIEYSAVLFDSQSDDNRDHDGPFQLRKLEFIAFSLEKIIYAGENQRIKDIPVMFNQLREWAVEGLNRLTQLVTILQDT